jgi:hypothetical protein
MGKKDRELNTILYPEYAHFFVDDFYISAPGDDEYHGHITHRIAHIHNGNKIRPYL